MTGPSARGDAATGVGAHVGNYLHGPYSLFLRGYRTAGTAPTQLLSIEQPAGAYPDPPADDLILTVVRRASGRAEIDMGAGRFRGTLHGGELLLTPPDTGTDIVADGGHALLVAAFPAGRVRAILDGSEGSAPRDFGRLHAAPFRDPFVEALCRRMWDEAAAGCPFGSLFMDGAVAAMLGALLRLAHPGAARPPRPAGALSAARLGRVRALMADRLREDLTLPDLAGAAGLSPFHFARAFRAATGASPHRELARARVERAKDLLVGTDLPLAEVAFRSGFKDQSHFGAVFRRATGTTPGRYRASGRT